MSETCPPTGCMDDICHGTQQCMMTGESLYQRCPVCDELSHPELDVLCACERADRDYEEGF